MLLKRQPATDRYALMSRTTAWFLVFFGFTAFGFLNFEYRYLDDLANNYQHTFAVRMLEEMTGAYTGLVLFPLVVWLVRRTRIRQNNWSRTVPLNLLIMVGFSVCDTRLMSLSRSVLSPVFGLGRYDYGIMLYRYPMEFAKHVLSILDCCGRNLRGRLLPGSAQPTASHSRIGGPTGRSSAAESTLATAAALSV